MGSTSPLKNAAERGGYHYLEGVALSRHIDIEESPHA